MEGLTRKIALGWSDGEQLLPITVRATSGVLPNPLKVTVSGFAEAGGGAQINRQVGFRVPGEVKISPTRTLEPDGARTQNLNLVFGEGGSDAGTFAGQVYLDSGETTLAQVGVTATAQSLFPAAAFVVLFVAGLVGWFLARQLQRFRGLRDQEKRLALVDSALLGIGMDLLPLDVQTQLGRARSALALRDAVVATEALNALDDKLIVGGLAQFVRGRFVPIQTKIDDQADNLQPPGSEDGRSLIAAERYRLGVLVGLSGTDLLAARKGSEALTERVSQGTVCLANLTNRPYEARSLAHHLLDDDTWHQDWTAPADEAGAGQRFSSPASSAGHRRRQRREVQDQEVDGRNRWRRSWDAITSPRAFLAYGMLLSLTLVSMVGLQVLYLADPTFGNDGLADWIGLVAWGVGIQAGATSLAGLLRNVTPQAGLDLIVPAEAPGGEGGSGEAAAKEAAAKEAAAKEAAAKEAAAKEAAAKEAAAKDASS